MRRKWLIVGVFLACTLGALAYALGQERTFAYTTSIELGEFGPQEYVASASGTKNTIEDRILLSVKRAFLQERDLQQMPFDVSVSTAEESSFVNLVSQAPLDRQDLVADFHEMIFVRLRDEHQQRLSILENESDSRLATLEEALEAEQRRMKVLEDLSSTNAAEAVEPGLPPRAETQAGDDIEARLTSSDAALTLLLSQLQLNERISQREKRINEIKGQLREEQTRRSWIKPTRAEDLAVASLTPVGTGRSLIVVLGALLGMMLGLFGALFAEFAAKVRETPES